MVDDGTRPERNLRLRQLSKSALIALSLAVVGPSAASAADGVTSTGPFTDYRQAVAAQYGTTTPPASGVAPATGQNNPPVVVAQPVANPPPPGSGAGPESAANQPGGSVGGQNVTRNLDGGRSLPFTGVDLLLIVLIGVGLIAAGALLHAGARVRRRVGLARPLG